VEASAGIEIAKQTLLSCGLILAIGTIAGLLLGMKAPGAQMIASVTFIAILMTILIQAPTIKWLGKGLGLLQESEQASEQQGG
jgi:NhaP-type Na+/H+ or K+/H+ antiporter